MNAIGNSVISLCKSPYNFLPTYLLTCLLITVYFLSGALAQILGLLIKRIIPKKVGISSLSYEILVDYISLVSENLMPQNKIEPGC